MHVGITFGDDQFISKIKEKMLQLLNFLSSFVSYISSFADAQRLNIVFNLFHLFCLDSYIC